MRDILERIIEPAVLGMRKRGRPFRGVLYCGIMMTGQGPMVVEFNSRFGDPEAQVILPLLEDDFAELAVGISEGRMPDRPLTWKRKAATCVVVASGGYPGDYNKGMEISGLDRVDEMDDVFAFHADTARRDGKLVTNGGRILGVTALADDLGSSIDRAYDAVDRVRFEHRYFRRDIGQKGLRRMA
jgi:phosphoribosylamine--glycine ligase